MLGVFLLFCMPRIHLKTCLFLAEISPGTEGQNEGIKHSIYILQQNLSLKKIATPCKDSVYNT